MPSKTVLVPTAHAKPFSEATESHEAGGALKRTQVNHKLRPPSRFFCWYSQLLHILFCALPHQATATQQESPEMETLC